MRRKHPKSIIKKISNGLILPPPANLTASDIAALMPRIENIGATPCGMRHARSEMVTFVPPAKQKKQQPGSEPNDLNPSDLNSPNQLRDEYNQNIDSIYSLFDAELEEQVDLSDPSQDQNPLNLHSLDSESPEHLSNKLSIFSQIDNNWYQDDLDIASGDKE